MEINVFNIYMFYLFTFGYTNSDVWILCMCTTSKTVDLFFLSYKEYFSCVAKTSGSHSHICNLQTVIPIMLGGWETVSLMLVLEPPEQFPCRRFENLQNWNNPVSTTRRHLDRHLSVKTAASRDPDLFITPPTNPVLLFLSAVRSLS